MTHGETMTETRTATTTASNPASPVLVVNGIEVIYNHVILVLKGVSLQLHEKGIVALLGGNGAGKTTTLRAISNLLKGERGEVTKGSIELRGEPIQNLSPSDLVKRESGKRLISLDPNVRLNPQPDIQLWRERVAELVKYADLIKVSDEDLHLLYPDQSPESVLEGWLQHRCQLVFLTRGGNGASVFSRQHGHWSQPAVKVVMADTVGAGDTFQAALIAWLTEQQLDSVEGLQQLTRAQIDAMLGFAIRAAAMTCGKTGPDLPYRQQLG